MNLHKTRIDWASHTWNPVTGCLHGCDYCYARKTAIRFGLHQCERPSKPPLEILPKGSGCFCVDEPTKLYDQSGKYIRSTPYPAGFAPTLHTYTLDYPVKREIPSTVFVSSMGDLFGEWVCEDWIEQVFNAAKRAPWHTYLFLTKNPGRYIELDEAGRLPHDANFWYGSTVTNPEMPYFSSTKVNTFLSIEPLMAPFLAEEHIGGLYGIDWVIVGAMTGNSRFRHQPKREWVEEIVEIAMGEGVPVFMKDNLSAVWGGKLIQEYPENMPAPREAKEPVPRCKECELSSTKEHGARGASSFCEIGWEAEGYTDRGPRHIPAAQARTSPSWCPKRNGKEGGTPW